MAKHSFPLEHATWRGVMALVLAGLYLVSGALVGAVRALPPASGAISLVGQLTLPEMTIRNSDIWGWVDPNTSKEYAVIGKWPSFEAKLYIVDITTPTSPFLVNVIDSVPAFDVKVWQTGTSTYLYSCDGNSSGTDSEIWNVTNPLSPVFEGTFPSCHNIFIDDQGYMYLSFSTLRIYNLNPDPTAPAFVWTDGLAGGHDATVIGNRLYDFHGYDGTFIYDVSNRNTPIQLGMIPEPSGIAYHHSGWTSADGKFLFINDELGSPSTADITVWNIANPVIPFKVDEYIDPNATIHNSFRKGDYLYTSFYVAGFRVFDIGAPWSIFLSDEYDTAPGYTGNGVYEGCWGVYAGSPSGLILASDMQNGLYIFSFSPPAATGVPDDVPQTSFVLNQNYPNPFNPSTTISYELPLDAHVTLTVFSATGGKVRTLIDTRKPAGPQSVSWNGENDEGKPVASGVYFYTLQVGVSSSTKRMILLK